MFENTFGKVNFVDKHLLTGGFGMKMLIKENTINWYNFLSDHTPKVEFIDISNRFKEIAHYDFIVKDSFDVFIFDINENIKSGLNLLQKLRIHNPDIKSIVVTSNVNRKYRSDLVYKQVDHFLFKESDMDILKLVLRQMNLRLTRAGLLIN
jgi:DNA-binding NarL/FixJ family response regulator